MTRIMLNWDDSALAYHMHSTKRDDYLDKDKTIKYVKNIMHQYSGTPVSDILICVNSRISVYPSKSIESYTDSFNRKQLNGIDVDYSKTWLYYNNLLFNIYEIDYVQLWIEELKQLNINPWISFRMNDVHNSLDEESLLAPEFFYENPNLRRVLHHNKKAYFDNAFDYAQESIRNRMLAFIDESLYRYDVYGIELDWMREAFCFSLGGEFPGKDILNEFMHDVKKMVKKHEKLRGHKIHISARVPSGVETAFYMGFDCLHWAENKYVDWLIITPRWSSTDTDMPVELWKSILKNYDVQLGTGLETILRNNRNSPITFQTAQTHAASATAYFAAGTDALYMFNYMSFPENTIYYEEEELAYFVNNIPQIISSCNNLQAAASCNRRHILTFKDLTAPWERTIYSVPAVCNPDTSEYNMFRIRTGPMVSGQKAYVVLALSDDDKVLDAEDIKVFVNGIQTGAFELDYKQDYYAKPPLYIFPINQEEAMKDINIVQVAATNTAFTIEHIEIRINN